MMYVSFEAVVAVVVVAAVSSKGSKSRIGTARAVSIGSGIKASVNGIYNILLCDASSAIRIFIWCNLSMESSNCHKI